MLLVNKYVAPLNAVRRLFMNKYASFIV